MKTSRIVGVSLIGAIAAFAVPACTAKQPVPECDVTQASTGLGLAPFYVQMQELSRSGCDPAVGWHHIWVGMERFHPPLTKDFSLAIRSSMLVDDTAFAQDNFGVIGPAGIGDIARTDPADPKGTNILVNGKMSQFPTNGVCTVTDISGGVQNYQAEDVDHPAITVKTDWTDLQLFSTASVPGTGWNAKIKYTAGSCTIDYQAKAFWPVVGCETDEDCNPFENPDAGRFLGSGINPNFKPKCDTSIDHTTDPAWTNTLWGYATTGVCVPSVELSTLK